jgi:hypothetical protein
MGIWWVLGTICFLLVVLGVIFLVYFNAKEARHKKYVMDNGEPIIGWIVQANSNLYEKGNWDYPAQILITFDDSIEDEFMEELIARVGALKDKSPGDPDKRKVADLVTDETYRPRTRVKLPRTFTDGAIVYSTGVMIERDLLPNRILDKPYIHCQAIRDDPTSDVYMLPYPESNQRAEDEDY